MTIGPTDGEENQFSFETFPFVALSKTYSVNQQTSDSAPTMTAMVTGVKTGDGLISVNSHVARGDHTQVTDNTLLTILEIAEQNGLSTGWAVPHTSPMQPDYADLGDMHNDPWVRRMQQGEQRIPMHRYLH